MELYEIAWWSLKHRWSHKPNINIGFDEGNPSQPLPLPCGHSDVQQSLQVFPLLSQVRYKLPLPGPGWFSWQMEEERFNCLKRRSSSAFWVGAAQDWFTAIAVNSGQRVTLLSAESVVAAAAWIYRFFQYCCWGCFSRDWEWCFTKDCHDCLRPPHHLEVKL